MTAEELIPIYHGLFYACMAGTVLFAALAVLLFFRFDIRHVFNVQSGRAEKMTVERMRAENAATGRLIRTAETAPSAVKVPVVVQPTSSEIQPTTSLAKSGAQQTTAPIAAKNHPAAPAAPAGRKFVIRQKVVLIHTNELI